MIAPDLFFKYSSGSYFFILMLIVPLIAMSLYAFRKSALKMFLAENIMPRSRFNYWSKVFFVCLALFCAILALMQPVGNGHYPPGFQQGKLQRPVHDVIFLVDASASMGVKDVGETRLQYAKEVTDEIISQLKGESVALWAFTSKPTLLSPLTMDYLYVRLRLKQLKINEGGIGGTDINLALSKVLQGNFSPKYRSLVILSDGGDESNVKIEGAEALNLRVYTVGIGSVNGMDVPGISYEGKPVLSKLNSSLLKSLAVRGAYFDSNNQTAVEIAQDIVSRIEREVSYKDLQIASPSKDLIYDLYFQIPLAIAILFLIFYLTFPDTRRYKV